MKTITLDGSWRGKGISPGGNTVAFAGTVPGCVHTDLLREGKIPEPFYRYNADECQWIESWSWSMNANLSWMSSARTPPVL